jgi:hypothetical protein
VTKANRPRAAAKRRAAAIEPRGFSVLDASGEIVSTGYGSRGAAMYDARFLLGPRLGFLPTGWRVLSERTARKLRLSAAPRAMQLGGL